MLPPTVNSKVMALKSSRVGWGDGLALIPYSNRFRAHRKQMAQILGSKAAVSHFDGLQEVEVGRFLLQILKEPDGVLEHFRR